FLIIFCSCSLYTLFAYSFSFLSYQTYICAFFFVFAHSNQYLRPYFYFCALERDNGHIANKKKRPSTKNQIENLRLHHLLLTSLFVGWLSFALVVLVAFAASPVVSVE